MLVRILGPVDVVDDEGNNVALRGLVSTRLLALLVAGRPGEVPVDDLALEIWSEAEAPADPVGALRTVVTRVRAALGPESIVTGTGSYRLGDIETDVDRFQDLVERARRSSGSPTVADLWRQALDLWRGPAFGDHSHADSIQAEANRLEELRAEATEAWFDARLAAGEGRELVADVEAAATEFPLREGFRAQQMTVLSRAGRQADALRAFQDFRGDMTEIGLEPSDRLVELETQIAVGQVPRSGARRTLRGYELGDRLGEGAFAIVHSARQASVDRPVAIKQIRADLADQPEFIRQFEAEAHLVARLEHPHIVPLYDYWREPGSAYLVMRHLEGGSLSSRIIDQPFAVGELAPMVSQVAAGLDEAHRSGVIHRDVKPANILLDSSDNAYLSDFGIAVEEQERLDPEAWLSNGSPVYAPPEQLRREAVGPTADVHALGVSVFEALTGHLPFPTETTMAGLLKRQLNDPIPLVRSSHPDIPAAVDSVLQKATAKDPSERHQTAGEFANDLAVASGLEGDAALIVAEDRNPYKGLSAFDEADAGDFAGRDRLVSQLVSAVTNERAVLVVGPSGSGKSSVVRAGLLPALRNDAAAGSSRWFVTTMIPGAAPFSDLAEALLRVAVDPPPDLASELATDANGITRMVRRLIPKDREVVLVVDQFEELFTLANEKDRERFLDGLVAATTESETPFRFIATLRADFYDQPLRHPGFAKLIRDATVPVHPLAADELERAITEPARAVGAGFEPGLVAEITADIADQPGALPLLQYALTELYDWRDGDTMTRHAYNELGGVSGALARRAEEVFDASNAEQQAATRRLFGRLVNLGEGTEDTRRRILRNEVAGDAGTEASIDAYGLARLLSFDRDSASREPTVEVAHEALIREWPRLRSWLDDDRAGLRILRHLTETATSWDQNGREDGELYRGGRLEAAHEWANEHSSDLNVTEASFLSASTEQRNSEAETEQRVNRRLRRLLTGVGIVAVVALIAGLLAFQQRGEASDNAATAETERIAAEAASRVDDNPQLALLLAAEAHNRDPGPTGLGALQQVLTNTGNFLGIVGGGIDFVAVEWLDDERLIGAGPDGVFLINLATGDIERTHELAFSRRDFDDGNDHSLVPSPLVDISGPLLAGIEADHSCCLTVANITTGEVDRSDLTHDDPIVAVAVHAGRGLAFTLGEAGTLRTFDAATLELLREIDAYPEATLGELDVPSGTDWTAYVPGFDLGLVPIAFFPPELSLSSNGQVVATTTAVTRFFDVSTGELLEETTVSYQPEDGRPFPRPGRWVVYPEEGRSLIATSTSIFPEGVAIDIESTGGFHGLPNLAALEWVGDNRLLVQFTDKRAAVVDASTGRVDGTEFTLPLVNPGRLVLSPDGDTVAVPSGGGIGMWSLSGQQLIARGFARENAQNGSINPAGTELTASGSVFWFMPSGDVAPRRVEVSSGLSLPLPGADGINSVGYLGDDEFLSSWSRDFKIRRLDQQTGEELALYEQEGGMNGLIVHRASGRLAMGTSEGVEIFDTKRGGPPTQILPEPIFSSTVAFSADGQRLAATRAADGVVHVWDLSTSELVEDGSSFERDVRAMRFSPDGRYLITASGEGVLTLRDPETYQPIRDLLGARTEVLDTDIWFSSDGRLLLSGGLTALRIWDLESGEQIGGTFPNATGFHFGGNDGLHLVTAADDEFLAVWNLNVDQWYEIACRAAGRNMTRDEWEQFGPSDQDYRATCPQWPLEQ